MQNDSPSKSGLNSNIFAGFSMKLDPQDERKKNTPNFTIQVENGFLHNEYQLKSKVDLFVKLFIENQHFKTPISVDCGRNPKWGKETLYPFYENQLVDKNYMIQFQLWNYQTELGDIQLGSGQLDLINAYDNRIKQAKIVINDINNQEKQIGYIIANLQFAFNFTGGKKKELPRYTEPYKFTKPQNIEGYKIQKSELQERTQNFEERMRILKEKYHIEPNKQQQQQQQEQDLQQYQDIEISSEVYKAIHEGLVQIGRDRPSNPLRELGNFLCNYKGSQQNRQQYYQPYSQQQQY